MPRPDDPVKRVLSALQDDETVREIAGDVDDLIDGIGSHGRGAAVLPDGTTINVDYTRDLLDNVIYLRPDQRPPVETMWIGEPPEPVPGWWKCLSCGHRKDRAGSHASEVWCARGHKATKMEVVGT